MKIIIKIIILLMYCYIIGIIINRSEFFSTTNIPEYDIQEIPNFLSDEECDTIIELAKDRLFTSKVYNGNDDNLDNSIRISEQCWLQDHIHPTIQKISDKSADITNTKDNMQEELQVVSYGPGGFFKPHYDSCYGDEDYCNRLDSNGYRLATVLIYLNDNFEGGETVFPNINKSVKPVKGKAVLFYNSTIDGKVIHESFHGGNPVKNGNKYICNKWIKTKKIN